MSYVRTLAICLLLVCFVGAAGCHCFDLSSGLAKNDKIMSMFVPFSQFFPVFGLFFETESTNLTSQQSNTKLSVNFCLTDQLGYNFTKSVTILTERGDKLDSSHVLYTFLIKTDVLT